MTTRRPGRWRGRRPRTRRLADLAFAWRAVRAVKSNAILLAQDGAHVGVGMGRSTGSTPAGWPSSGPARSGRPGAVAASDAFFPFADGLQVLLDAGRAGRRPARRVVRDEEVIEAAHAAGVTLYLTGTRHFAHSPPGRRRPQMFRHPGLCGLPFPGCRYIWSQMGEGQGGWPAS